MTTGIQLLDDVLLSIVGDQAELSVLPRERGSAMTAALEIAERVVGPRRVVWVENGPGSMFSLPQPTPGTAVVSDRAIELSGLIRTILLDGKIQGVLEAVAEQTFFEVAAEQALVQGRVGAAVKAIAKAGIGRSVYLAGPGDLVALRTSALSAGYMATWCFGMLHEIGHLVPQPYDGHPLTSDDALLDRLSWLSTEWAAFRTDEFGDPSERAIEQRSLSVVGLDHLREEVHADLFAVGVLLEATRTAMAEAGEPLRWESFIREAHAAQQIVVVFDRLQRAVTLSGASSPTRDDVVEMAMQPLSVGVRATTMMDYLAGVLAFEGSTAIDSIDGAEMERQHRFVEDCIRPLEPRYELVERALSKVIDFMLNRESETDEWELLENLAVTLRKSLMMDPGVARFVELAKGLGRTSYAMAALRRLAEHPTEPLSPTDDGEMLVSVPWIVRGSEHRPLVHRADGHSVIFAFPIGSQLVDAYFESVEQHLVPDWGLEHAWLVVNHPGQVGPALVERMPEGEPFVVVVEGEPGFHFWFGELTEGRLR